MKYAQLLRAGTLTDHLEQVNEEAKILLEVQIERLEMTYPAPDCRNQLEWVRQMKGLKCLAEEVIKAELIYANQVRGIPTYREWGLYLAILEIKLM